MLIGRHDIENLMRRDPASACLPCSVGELNTEYGASSGESSEIEMEISDTLLKLRPIRQVSSCGSFLGAGGVSGYVDNS